MAIKDRVLPIILQFLLQHNVSTNALKDEILKWTKDKGGWHEIAFAQGLKANRVANALGTSFI